MKDKKQDNRPDEPDFDSASDPLLLAGCHFIFFTDNEEAAMTCIDESIRMNPLSARAWYTKGFLLMLQDELEQALKCYEKTIELRPTFGVVWSNKSGVLKKLGRHKEADYCQEKSRELCLQGY